MDMNDPNPNLLDMMTSTDNLTPPVIPTPSMQVNETQFMNELNLSATNCDISDEFDGLSFLDDDFLNDIINSDDVSGEISIGNGSNNPPPVVPTPSMEVNESQVIHELEISTTNCDTNDEFDGLSLVDDDFSIPWDMFEINENINNDVPREISNDDNGTTRLEVMSTRAFRDNNGPDFETGGTSTIRVPVTPTISDGVRMCSCCNVLQQLVHSDGYERNTLEIRGGIGFFCHAILEIRPFAGCKERRYQTLDLKDLTMEQVKDFIEDYCLERVTKNLLLVQDTIYQNANTIDNQSQTLTIPSSDDVPTSLVTPDQRLNVPPVSTTGLPKESRRRKTPLAAQRERTGKMTVKDICMHFHLPIEEAGKKMNVCPTVLKKICRKGGLKRWPCRKIQCLERKIELVRTSKNAAVRANADAEIDRLQKQIDKICNVK